MTAMKTFDNTRPIVAAMALGIGRAAYEYARDFVKENYVLSRPIAALRGDRRAARARRAGGSRRRASLTWRAAWHGRRRDAEREGGVACRRPPRARPRSTRASRRSRSAAPHGSIATEHALLEKWFRDIKVYDIFEGTGNIQRIVISKRIFRI